MKKILVVALVFVVFFGCKSKRIVVNTNVKDTIYKSEVVEKTSPQLTELVIENVCDSLGNLRQFNLNASNKSVKTIFKTDDNSIYIHQNIDSIKQVAINEFQKNTSKIESETITSKYPKLFWYLLIYAILATLWNFKKYIPYLNLI